MAPLPPTARCRDAPSVAPFELCKDLSSLIPTRSVLTVGNPPHIRSVLDARGIDRRELFLPLDHALVAITPLNCVEFGRQHSLVSFHKHKHCAPRNKPTKFILAFLHPLFCLSVKYQSLKTDHLSTHGASTDPHVRLPSTFRHNRYSFRISGDISVYCRLYTQRRIRL
jgi:hypothetical protein